MRTTQTKTTAGVGVGLGGRVRIKEDYKINLETRGF